MLGAGAVVAQQDVVKRTQDTMKANGKNMGGVLRPMVKGEKPYDQAAVDAALGPIRRHRQEAPTLFPESIKDVKWEGDYGSSPKIWEDKAGFDCQDRRASPRSSPRPRRKIKDLDTLKANFPAIGKAVRRLPRDIPPQEGLIAIDSR